MNGKGMNENKRRQYFSRWPWKGFQRKNGQTRGWSNELDLCALSCVSRHQENNHEKLGSVRSVEITSVALVSVVFKGQEWSLHTQCSNQIAAFLGNAVPLKCLLKPLISKTNMLALSSEPTVIRCKQLKQAQQIKHGYSGRDWEMRDDTLSWQAQNTLRELWGNYGDSITIVKHNRVISFDFWCCNFMAFCYDSYSVSHN